MSNALFETFKREKQFVVAPLGKAVRVNFCLLFDEHGAYVEVRNEKGVPIQVDYQQYSGVVRTILKSIHAIENKSNFIIDWENAGGKVYLHENDYLIEMLLQSKLWTDEKGTVITAAAPRGKTYLVMSPVEQGKKINAAVQVLSGDEVYTNFKLINENNVYVDGKVIEIPSIGRNFHSVLLFNSQVGSADVAKFLSLFFSYVQNVELSYENYTVSISKDVIVTTPVLIFEKIDAGDSLYMRVSQVLPGIDPGLLNDYDLQYFATVNEVEQIIDVKPVEQESIEAALQGIEKILQKHVPKQGKKKTVDIVLENDLFIIPREVAAGFIYNDLPALLTSYKVLGAEKLRTYKISTATPRLELKLNHGIDFLEGDATLHFNDEAFSLFDALQQYNKNRYILLSDGTHATVNESYMQKLQRLFKKKKENAQISFFDLPLVEDLIDEKIAAETFKKSKSIFEGFNALQNTKVKLPAVQAVLRPYIKSRDIFG